MLKPQAHHHSNSALTRQHKAFVAGYGCGIGGGTTYAASFLSLNVLALPIKQKPFSTRRHRCNPASQTKAVASQTKMATETTSITAVITVQPTIGESLLLELVAAEVDPNTGLEKATLKEYAHPTGQDPNHKEYMARFEIPEDFGEIGAILVENEHDQEIYLKEIELKDFSHDSTITINPKSWVHSKFVNPEKRVFFTNKSYLPSKTPSGLETLRKKDLATLRGDGVADGPRKKHQRIYDYDFYNDLGDPDQNRELGRPVLGTKDLPYPRRCKTGRPSSKSDPLSESKSTDVYVPRDEAFSNIKFGNFSLKTCYSALHALRPSLQTIGKEDSFPCFTAIESLFNNGVHLPQPQPKGFPNKVLSIIVNLFKDAKNSMLQFETPEMINRDKFCWMKDEEFCRQTLAGLNPCTIQLVKEWPLKSKLDPEVYGPPESAITTELVEQVIRGFTTIEEAIQQKKLFILDYHDLLLPFVNKVREIKEMRTTLYGSRTLMYLTPTGTLRPVAIELVRPPGNGKPQWKRAFTPSWDSTGAWLWKLAKVHALAHDTGVHQLVSHWLRTHCCTEPYIIATNRQLSEMHPIYRLLHPHFRYTMGINAYARKSLINAGGIIESCFSPGKYSIELSSIAYDKLWCFIDEALPADLISRGMAEEDPNSRHGLKLAIEDYPYANDGLDLWDAIKDWVSDYVNHYYPEENLVEFDEELQAWWTEIRTRGHEDKKDEPWWPVLKTPQDLIKILTTIIWVTSGHHAAINFGQYDFAGYFPNRSTIARVKLPCEDQTDEEWESFKRRPEDELLSAFPSQHQALNVMTVLDVLSNHSPDEEYLGKTMEPSFEANPQIKAAYEIFAARLKELEGIIDGRNADSCRKNRNGVGIVPYQLLKPVSKVPNSISI